MGKLREKLKQLYVQILSVKAEPHQIAGGTAVGIFWSFSPLWGLHMLLSLITATVLNVSRIPALLIVHISNPLTAPFIYPITWKVGDIVLRPFVAPAPPISPSEVHLTLAQIFSVAGDAMIRMSIGGAIIGSIVAMLVYLRVLRAVTNARNGGKEALLRGAAGEPPPA